MQQRRPARCRRTSGRASGRAPLGRELKLSCALPPLLLLRNSQPVKRFLGRREGSETGDPQKNEPNST